MGHAFLGQQFPSFEDGKNWADTCFEAKREILYSQHPQIATIMRKCMLSDGDYFEERSSVTNFSK